MTGTPCNFLSSQDGKVNTSKILFALAIESNLVEERLGKMTMVQAKKMILEEWYLTIIVCLFTCLFSLRFRLGNSIHQRSFFFLAIESNLFEERLGKMSMVQTKKIILKECYSTIIVCLLNCLFIQFDTFCSCH